MQNYFVADENGTDDLEIIFQVESISDPAEVLNPLGPQMTPYVFYVLIAITSMMSCTGILASVWNKILLQIGNNVIDNAKWLSLIICALQLWDSSSAVNLAIKILRRNDVS